MSGMVGSIRQISIRVSWFTEDSKVIQNDSSCASDRDIQIEEIDSKMLINYELCRIIGVSCR